MLTRTPNITIPLGATVVVHRAGQLDKRYIFRGGPPWQFEDDKGAICATSPLEEPFVGVTVTDPDTGDSTYYSPV